MPQGLCIKVSAQPLIRKWFFIFRSIKLIFTRKVVHLASVWFWGFLGLGSLRTSSPIWASEASRARTRERSAEPREAPRPPLSRLLSRASRASAFHDIPKWRACSQASYSEVPGLSILGTKCYSRAFKNSNYINYFDRGFCISKKNLIYRFSTVILASHSFLQFVAFRCRSAFSVASDWFFLPI